MLITLMTIVLCVSDVSSIFSPHSGFASADISAMHFFPGWLHLPDGSEHVLMLLPCLFRNFFTFSLCMSGREKRRSGVRAGTGPAPSLAVSEGDVNGDGDVNVGDIMAVINIMAGKTL